MKLRRSTGEPAKVAQGTRRKLLASVALAGGVSASLLVTGNAFGVTGCRGDPLVTLSDGTSIRLVTWIGLDSSQVGNVGYNLQIPQGLSVTNVQFDNGPLPETLAWTANMPVVDRNGNHRFSDQVTIATNGVSGPGVQATVYASATQGAVQDGNVWQGHTGGILREDFQFSPYNSDSTCQGDVTLSGSISRNLIVPNGVTCTVDSLTVGGNVQLQPGATLTANDLEVGQQVQAQNGSSLTAATLTVGQSVQVQSGGSITLSGGYIQRDVTCDKGTHADISNVTIGGRDNC